MRRAGLLTALALTALMAAAPARATVVTALPDGVLVPIPALKEPFGPGPHVFGPSITWTSTFDSSVFGYTGGYGFAANGFWDGTLGPMAGLNGSTDFNNRTDTMSFAFSSPVAGVGGFLNYTPGSPHPTVIAVYDSSMNLLESFELTFLVDPGSTNHGAFYGFLRDNADIGYFTLTDNYVGITQLTVQDTPEPAVPEPGTLILLGAGLAGLASRRRRR